MDPRKLLRIAWWEVTKNAGGVDTRTVVIVVVAAVLVGGLGPVVATDDLSLDDGLYRVSVSDESPYYPVAASDDTFAIVPGADRAAVRGGDVDVVIQGRELYPADRPKGLAALAEFRDSVRQYNERQLREEPNETAAFPVVVTLTYRPQTNPQIGPGGDGSGADGGASDGTAGDGTGDTSGDEPAASGDGADPDEIAGGDALGGLGAGLADDESTTTGSPASIEPPFPFRSLILAFLFVIPLNFLIQAYGSTILSERINRRGELLLVAPVSRIDIIAGKTLPYFLGALVVEGVIAVGLTYLATGSVGGLVSVIAVTPLVLLFLAAAFLGAMFARSFKELTFVTVTITVTLTTYAFVPAIFTSVGPVALISPLTLVVRDLGNEAITLTEFAFSVTPPTLTAAVLFGLGTGLYREEDMFTQRPIPLKILDALAGPITKRWHVGVVSAVLVPFVFVAELLAIALLFALGELSVPLVIVFVAIIEEVAKSLHVYAGYAHRRFDVGRRTALVVGTASGVGFFAAEKLAVLAQLVGLPELAVGNAALNTGIVSGPILVAFLLAPLVLHVVTASISALGARRGRRPYVLALALAVTIHLLYNLTVLEVAGLG